MPLDYNETFRRLGGLYAAVERINEVRGAEVPAMIDDLAAGYAGDLAVIDGLYASLASYQSSHSGFLAALAALAGRTVADAIDDDEPIASSAVSAALAELVSRMEDAGQSVAPNTVSAVAVPSPANAGNPAWVLGVRAASGRVLENLFAEDLTATCTADGQPGGSATAGSESIAVAGQAAATGGLDWRFPRGSGAAAGLTVVDASRDAVGGPSQWLTNGDFDSWSGSFPSDWQIAAATAGNQVQKGLNDFTGADSLAFVGDDATLTFAFQEFGVDTPITFTPLRQVAWNLWARLDVLPAAGVLEVSLCDGNGSIIADDQGTPNAYAYSLPAGLGGWGGSPWGSGGWGVGSGGGGWGEFAWGDNPWGANVGPPFVPLGGMFRTPRALPPSVRFRIRLSTALSSGSTLTIDRVALAEPVSLYVGGPKAAVFAGSVNPVVGDEWTIRVLNNRRGGFQTAFDRLFGMRSLGLLLPSNVTPTIPDSLIA